MGSIVETELRIPTRLSGAGLQSDGSVDQLRVGAVICSFKDLGTLEVANGPIEWTKWVNDSYPLASYFGPASPAEASTLTFGLRIPQSGTNRSATLYAAANRGRGQVYPDGTASNISAILVTTNGMIH